MVDNQAHSDRNVFVFEKPDALWCTVLINLKVLLAQIGDKAPLPVDHRSGQHHEGNIHGDTERLRVVILLYLWSPVSGADHQDKEEKGRKSDSFRYAMISGPRQPPPHSSATNRDRKSVV